jgi:hypothetical protein
MHLPTTALLTALLGCAPDEVADSGPDAEVAIDGSALTLSADSLDFGELPLEEAVGASLELVITNEGGAAGTLVEVSLPEGFSLPTVIALSLAPGESLVLEVTFTPDGGGEYGGGMVITTSEEAPLVASLAGTALAPRLTLTPEAFDLGAPFVGCEQYAWISLDNTGTEPLEITALDFEADSDELSLALASAELGPLPWTLRPEDPAATLQLTYRPLDEARDEGWLTVTSSDPAADQREASFTGAGVTYGTQTDRFERGQFGALDVLISIDKSGSMSDPLAQLRAALPTLLEGLSARGTDYHLGLVSEDDGCFSSTTFIDSGAPIEDQLELLDAMLSGGSGVFTEATFQLMLNALATSEEDSGGCNEGFLRGYADLALIGMSDEREQSPNDWSYYVEVFRDLKADDDVVVVHAITTDFPSGCDGRSAGVGYYEATLETGGEFLSICAEDYTAHMEALLGAMATEDDTVVLSQEPVPETIAVEVDGAAVSSGWTYSGYDAGNYLSFASDALPAAGATITVSYTVAGDCSH